MPRLIPLPDTSAPLGAPRLWINPEHITSATAIRPWPLDRPSFQLPG